MNKNNYFLLIVGAALLAAPLAVPAQKTSTATKAPVHHAAAAKQDTIKLPPSIPPAAGAIHAAYALRYIDIKTGTGALAEPGLTYSVHYTGWLYDGTKFDSSVDRGTPFQFRQGQQRVIVGWDTGFEGMKVGGKRRLFIPYQLAYGTKGKGPIPAKANLIFDMELMAVTGPDGEHPAGAPQQ